MNHSTELPAPVTAENDKNSLPTHFFGLLRNLRWAPTTTVKQKRDEESQEASTSAPNLSPDDLDIVTNEDILSIVESHKLFRMPSVTENTEVKDLPNFYDTTEYNVTEEVQSALWAREVSRLVEVVTGNDPIAFNASSSFQVDSKKSYELFTELADQVWHSLNILSFDAESTMARHNKELCNGKIMERSRSVLQLFCNKDEDTDDIKPEEKKPRRDDFVHFVNYFTAVVARIMCQAARGKSFHANILAHMARISTKLKVLSANPEEYSLTSLANGRSAPRIPIPELNSQRERQGNNSKGPSNQSNQNNSAEDDPTVASQFGSFLINGVRAMNTGDSEEWEGSSKKDVLKAIYFVTSAKFHLIILEMLNFIVISVRGRSRLTRTSITSYEMCATVYNTGFEKFSTLVFQDRDHDFLGTSDASSISYARNIFNNLNQTVQYLLLRPSSRVQPIAEKSTSDVDDGTVHPGANEMSVGTRLSWAYSPDHPGSDDLLNTQTITFNSMSQVISVLVPLILASPAAVHKLAASITMLIFAEFDEERQKSPIRPVVYDTYTAFFNLSTQEYEDRHSRRRSKEAQSLSNSLVRRKTLVAAKNDNHFLDVGSSDDINMSDMNPTHNHYYVMERRRKATEKARELMDTWVLEEKGVMVQCNSYVIGLMCLCALVVAGGIAFGASVGERVPGVDPFDITSYCWLLSAFLLLMAKSIRVQTWSWTDFLHGRVLCKSVSELSSVTGIDNQLILAKLLQDESVSYLQTRGPYNTVFKRKSDDGFSIDRPLKIWTMFLSGLIMIEVESARGAAVVCLDLRRGTSAHMIANLGDVSSKEEEAHYIYGYKLSEKDQSRGSLSKNRIRLKSGQMNWMQALGIYGNEDAEFT